MVAISYHLRDTVLWPAHTHSVSGVPQHTYRLRRELIDRRGRKAETWESGHTPFCNRFWLRYSNNNRRIWNVVAATELRVQKHPQHITRIPDVCVLRRTDPVDAIVHTAPLVCIEVLSHEIR